MKIIFALIVLLCVFCSVLGARKPEYFTKCVRDYTKMGCYREGNTTMKLIVSDRDFKDKELDWNNFEKSIHSLACRCSAKAKELNYTYFSIRYYAECWAGKDETELVKLLKDKSKRREEKCISYEFGKCGDDNSEECVGSAHHEYFYSMPINGGYSQWNEWKPCNAECGGGSKTRSRTCTNPKPLRLGKDCEKLGASTESTSCNTHACPVDGGLSNWSPFGRCSATCGGGTQSRQRSCTQPRPANGGSDCTGSVEQTQSCARNPCKVHPCEQNNGDCSQICNRMMFNRKVCSCKSGYVLERNGRTCKEVEKASKNERNKRKI